MFFPTVVIFSINYALCTGLQCKEVKMQYDFSAQSS